MKKKIFTFLIMMLITAFMTITAQVPPSPNGDGTAPEEGSNTPVGGGAPIAGGMGILLAVGAAYGMKKVYHFNKNKQS